MPGKAETDDIEFDRIRTVQRQIQEAAELGHVVFYLYVLLDPKTLAAMHAALKQYGYRVQGSRAWTAPDGPGQRCKIVRDASTPASYAVDIAAAKAVLRQFRTCDRCRHRDSGPHGCGNTELRTEARKSGVALECACARPSESAMLLLGLVRRQLHAICALTGTANEQDQEN